MIADFFFELILEMIPEKIRKIVGIILIGIGILLSLIAIALWLVAGGTGILSVISLLLAIPILFSFLFGIIFISYVEWRPILMSLLEEEENELHTPSPSEDDRKKKEQELRMAYYSGKYPQKEDSKKIISCPPCGQKLNIPPRVHSTVCRMKKTPVVALTRK